MQKAVEEAVGPKKGGHSEERGVCRGPGLHEGSEHGVPRRYKETVVQDAGGAGAPGADEL